MVYDCSKNSVYKEIKANEMKMHLLHLKKSLGDEKPKMSTDNTLVNENVKVKKLIKGLEGEVSFHFVTIGEKPKKSSKLIKISSASNSFSL